jgi:hypothetical protein
LAQGDPLLSCFSLPTPARRRARATIFTIVKDISMALSLSIIGLLLLLVGFVSILIPLKFLRIRTRKIGFAVFFVGLVSTMIAGKLFLDEQAGEAGFDDTDEYLEAKNLGIGDPEALARHRAEQAETLARHRAEEVEAQGQAAITAERTAAETAGFASTEEYQVALAVGATTKENYDAYLRAEAFFRSPAKQQAFVEAVEKARQDYGAAENDLAKGRVRNARKQATCALFKSRSVDGWVGDLINLSSNSKGKGVIAIALSDDVTVMTMNNAFSDIEYKTLIEPTSPLSEKLMNLSEGERVRFSGTFFPSDIDCLYEVSLTLDGSMTRPEYIMRFSNIETP